MLLRFSRDVMFQQRLQNLYLFDWRIYWELRGADTQKKGKATKGLSSQTLYLQLQLHPHSPLTYLTNPIHPINCCYIQFRPTVMNRKWKDDEFIGPKNGPLWIIIFLSFSAESIAGCSAGASLQMHCRSFLISPIELNPGRCRSYARVPANYNRTIECSFTLHCWLARFGWYRNLLHMSKFPRRSNQQHRSISNRLQAGAWNTQVWFSVRPPPLFTSIHLLLHPSWCTCWDWKMQFLVRRLLLLRSSFS